MQIVGFDLFEYFMSGVLIILNCVLNHTVISVQYAQSIFTVDEGTSVNFALTVSGNLQRDLSVTFRTIDDSATGIYVICFLAFLIMLATIFGFYMRYKDVKCQMQ